MDDKKYQTHALDYLMEICSVRPNRRTGSAGNKKATLFFEKIISKAGYTVDVKPFPCLDYQKGRTSLTFREKTYEVYSSPYSLGCNINTELVVVSSADELETISCRDRILLMKDDICSEQLMPKNFVFYNPDHHKKIYALLEEKQPAAIITATEKKPELVGALYPFPLIVDGDFDIPSAYCTDITGSAISAHAGEQFTLTIQSERIPSAANNVIAQKNQNFPKKIVITAHIDAYEDSPGASDNASGTVVLLLLGEMLSDYDAPFCIEIAAFNGEDHYSAGGQMDYLARYGSRFHQILLAINIDDVGYKEGKTGFSLYGCPDDLEYRIRSSFQNHASLVGHQPWYMGDHMIFVQKGIPSMAFTSEKISELMTTITHTLKDTPDIIDEAILVEIAEALRDLIIDLGKSTTEFTGT